MPNESRSMSEMPEELKSERDELASNHAFMTFWMQSLEKTAGLSR